MADEPKPSEILSLKNELVRDQERNHNKIKNYRNQRYGEGPIGKMPAGLAMLGSVIRSRASWDFAYRLTGTMTGQPLECHIEHKSKDKTLDAKKNNREVFDTTVLNTANDAPRYVLDAIPDGIVTDGVALLKVGLNADWEKLEDADFTDQIFIEDVDPLTYYPIRKGKKLRGYITIDNRLKRDLYKEFSLQSDANLLSIGENLTMPGYPIGSLGTSSVLEVMEYCDDEWVQIYIAGRMVQSMPNPYKRPNIFEALGVTTSSRDPSKASFSALEGMIDLEQEFDTILTVLRNAAIIATTVTGVELNDSQGITGRTNQPNPLAFQAGRATQVNGRFANPFPGLAAAFNLVQMVPVVQDLLQKQGLAPLFSGQVADRTPGYGITSLYSIARSAHNRLVRNYTTMLTDVVKFLEWIIVNIIKAPVHQKDLVLNPGDIMPARVEVLRPPIIPVDKHADGKFYTDAMMREIVSMRRTREEGFHMENPEAESDVIFLEKGERAIDEIAIEFNKMQYLSHLMAQQQQQQQRQLVDGNGNVIPPSAGVPTGQDGGRAAISSTQGQEEMSQATPQLAAAAGS